MEDLKEIKVTSAKDKLEEFKESTIWYDFKRELSAWKEGFRIEQDNIVDDAEESNPSTASVLMHLGDLNGRRKAVAYMLSLPDIFIQLIEEKAEERSDGR